METKIFKNLFDKTAQKNGFEKAFGGWLRESNECIITLDLQKSNFSNLYYLNIKIFVQGVFGNYSKSKDIIKKDLGAFSRTQPKEYSDVFDLETLIDDNEREKKLEIFFTDFMTPFANKSLTIKGVKELVEINELFLLPAVLKELKEKFQYDAI